MKKQNRVERKNNSTPSTNVVDKISITEDTICIVTFNLVGAFKKRESNANTKEEILKMKASPILDENKKGRFLCYSYNSPGRKLKPGEKLPKTFYVGNIIYHPYSEYTCSQRRVYNHVTLSYLSSSDSRPLKFKKGQWDNMSIKDKLIAHFTIDAIGLNPISPSFSFEFVN